MAFPCIVFSFSIFLLGGMDCFSYELILALIFSPYSYTKHHIRPWEFHVVPKLRSGAEKALDLEKGGNAVSRRALTALYDKLQADDQGIIFAFDGGNKIVAPKQIFTETKKISSEGAGDWVMVRSDAGKYGPAAAPPAGGGGDGPGGGGGDDPAPEGALERHYEVRILSNTDADAPDADR